MTYVSLIAINIDCQNTSCEGYSSAAKWRLFNSPGVRASLCGDAASEESRIDRRSRIRFSFVRLDLDNEPQPDALLRITNGGQSQVATDGFLDSAPELAAEVASSSVAYDLHQKLEVYRRHGVCEYVVWRTEDNAIDWFVLREGRYERLPLDTQGIYKSEVFPGLWLDTSAILAGDLAKVLQTLGAGTASPEHQEFVAAMEQRVADARLTPR